MKNFVNKKKHGQAEEQMGDQVDIGTCGPKIIPGNPLGQGMARRQQDEDETRRAQPDQSAPHIFRPLLLLL